jgi:hypothetical protein
MRQGTADQVKDQRHSVALLGINCPFCSDDCRGAKIVPYIAQHNTTYAFAQTEECKMFGYQEMR